MAGRDYRHDDRCLACHGACNHDKVKKCRLCPVALHAKCAVNGASGKEAHNATWQCPQHACSVCAKSTSAAGGSFRISRKSLTISSSLGPKRSCAGDARPARLSCSAAKPSGANFSASGHSPAGSDLSMT